MDCPNCKVNLVMTERSGIEIDYCPTCRGVWLDRGELDKIIERSAPELPREPMIRVQKPHYEAEKRYYSKDEYKYKKKKGLLGDLFDF